MIYIEKYDGQLGNQLLTYNNACQIARLCNIDVYTIPSDFTRYFKNIKTIDKLNNYPDLIKNSISLDAHQLNNMDKNTLIKLAKHKHIKLMPPYLGELFYSYNVSDPRDYLKLQDKYEYKLSENVLHIAIHFRWATGKITNPSKIAKNKCFLDTEYIIRSIDFCVKNFGSDKICFVLYGASSPKHFYINNEIEDTRVMENFPQYNQVKNYLITSKIPYTLCPTLKNVDLDSIHDFSHMTQTDIIIGNPSTFSTTAFFIGKKNKKLIYNEEWALAATKYNITFFKQLYKHGNEFYSIWKCL